jgi:hypothetical protein
MIGLGLETVVECPNGGFNVFAKPRCLILAFGKGNDDMCEHESQGQSQGTDAAWHSSLVQAWVNTRMERDKSVLTLSGAAVGLLVTLLVNFGVRTQCEALMYFFALMAFIVAILCALTIFWRNAEYLIQLHNGHNGCDSMLAALDRTLVSAFVVGILATVALGLIMVQRNQTQPKENAAMTIEKNGSKSGGMDKTASLNELGRMRSLDESLNQMARMQPDGRVARSFNNLSKMGPQSGGTNTNSTNTSGQSGGQGSQTSKGSQGAGGETTKK